MKHRRSNATSDNTAVEEFLLTSQAARLLALAPDTIRLLERAGRLPAIKTAGGVRLFDRRVVERLARDRKAADASSRPAGSGTEFGR